MSMKQSQELYYLDLNKHIDTLVQLENLHGHNAMASPKASYIPNIIN
jgi:hypothetical protein